MTVTDQIDESLVRSLRAEVAEELSTSLRSMAADGRRLDTDDEEMLTRQLIAARLDALASASIHSGQTVLTEDEEQVLTRAVFDRLFHLGLPCQRVVCNCQFHRFQPLHLVSQSGRFLEL